MEDVVLILMATGIICLVLSVAGIVAEVLGFIADHVKIVGKFFDGLMDFDPEENEDDFQVWDPRTAVRSAIEKYRRKTIFGGKTCR